MAGSRPPGHAKAERTVTEAECIVVAETAQVVTDSEWTVTEANSLLSRMKQVKKIRLPNEGRGPESGELAPPLKLFRRVIHDKYGQILDGLYTM